MKTFFISKEEDDIKRFMERLEQEEEDIVLVIPKGAHVRENHAFFKQLKNFTQNTGKNISVESIDEEALRTAKEAGLEAVHPLFGGVKKVSDVGAVRPEVDAEGWRERKVKPHRKEGEAESPEREQKKEKRRRRVSIPWKAILVVCAAVAAAAVLYTAVWSGVEIRVRFDKKPFSYTGVFLVDAAAEGGDAEKRVLPGQAFTSEKNLTQLFPASGSKQVAEKATGMLTIYNAFSSEPQLLVASTRFETPGGRIFRLTQQVRIPGAEVKEGKITPSKIQAAVVADAVGEEYNVDPTPRLTLPGFKGTAKYDKFYGALETGTKGGFRGAKPVPTSADLDKGKEQLTAILRSVLENNFLLGYPPDVHILPGASEFTVVRLSTNEATDEHGNFSVFGEAQVKAIGFKEADLKKILAEIGSGGKDSGLALEPLEVGYRDASADFRAGTLSFTVSATGTLTTSFSKEAFKKSIGGRPPADAQALVSKLPGFRNATISLRPFWLRSIPADVSRIKVIVE